MEGRRVRIPGDSYFESDPYGDNILYMNKLNSDEGTWSPISECPFAFYDVDGDGYGEVVVRVSAVPLNYHPSQDPDYANTTHTRPGARIWSGWGSSTSATASTSTTSAARSIPFITTPGSTWSERFPTISPP